MFYHRGQVSFKMLIPTLHEKHTKVCFPQRMGSTCSTFATRPQRNDHFCFHQNLCRGVSQITKCDSCVAWQANKNDASYRAWETCFWALQVPSRDIDNYAGTRPVLAGSGCFCNSFDPKMVRSDPSQYAPGARVMVVNKNSLKLSMYWPHGPYWHSFVTCGNA